MTTRFRPDQHTTGPWLDRLFPVRLPRGRMASVAEFIVRPTNLGILEGGLSPLLNARLRAQFVAYVRRALGDPIAQVEPPVEPLPELSTPRSPRARLPWMACAARLTSGPLDPAMCSSDLTLVWWQDAFAGPLAEEIERAAAEVDWEASARDLDFI